MKRLVLAFAIAISMLSITGASAEPPMQGVDRVQAETRGAPLGGRHVCRDLLAGAPFHACGAYAADGTQRPEWRGLN